MLFFLELFIIEYLAVYYICIMSKNNIITAVILVLAVLGATLWANKVNKEKGYSVVYMATGEVYIGKLSTLPDFTLTDSYQFQAVKDATDPTKSSFKLIPIKEALWATESMHLIKDNVVFYGALTSSSKIAETLAAQAK